MIEHIIFDFGGVILKFGSDAGNNKKTTGIPDELGSIFKIDVKQAEVFWKEHKKSLIKGLQTPKEFLEMMAKKLDHEEVDYDKSLKQWAESYKLRKEQIDWDVVHLIKFLKEKKYRVHLLTDAIDLPRGDDDWIIEIDNLWDESFRSYEQHQQKPGREAYENVLSKLKANAKSCIFIDDVKANITGAELVGMQGILYTDVISLKSELRKQHIIA